MTLEFAPLTIPPHQQIRAVFDERTIRVYQAFNKLIADTAVSTGSLLSPAFNLNRMTWIKPSFTWMMYRSGWATKEGQTRILSISMDRNGFEWAIRHSCLTHPGSGTSKQAWEHLKATMPVRIQWDPERNIDLQALPFRTVQIGLSKEAARLYVNEWIERIEDVTPLAKQISGLLADGLRKEATNLLPIELPYPFNPDDLPK